MLCLMAWKRVNLTCCVPHASLLPHCNKHRNSHFPLFFFLFPRVPTFSPFDSLVFRPANLTIHRLSPHVCYLWHPLPCDLSFPFSLSLSLFSHDSITRYQSCRPMFCIRHLPYFSPSLPLIMTNVVWSTIPSFISQPSLFLSYFTLCLFFFFYFSPLFLMTDASVHQSWTVFKWI